MKRAIVVLALAVTMLFGTMLPAKAAPAAILTTQQTTQACEPVDPIVSPGQTSAHPHKFYGAGSAANPVTPFTDTSAEFRQLPSVWTRTSNHSGFWVPCLFKNGVPVPPSSIAGLFYYQLQSNAQVPPENMKGVTQEVGYRCGFGGGTVTNLPPASCGSGEFVISGFFRGDRDFGVSNFGNIRFFLRFNMPYGAGDVITLGTPQGAVPLDAVHADYIFAHDRVKFQNFINQCAGVGCGRDPAVLA